MKLSTIAIAIPALLAACAPEDGDMAVEFYDGEYYNAINPSETSAVACVANFLEEQSDGQKEARADLNLTPVEAIVSEDNALIMAWLVGGDRANEISGGNCNDALEVIASDQILQPGTNWAEHVQGSTCSPYRLDGGASSYYGDSNNKVIYTYFTLQPDTVSLDSLVITPNSHCALLLPTVDTGGVVHEVSCPEVTDQDGGVTRPACEIEPLIYLN